MKNMSYCRFENTLSDLEECYYALETEGWESLSASEMQHAHDLIKLCRNIADDFEHELTEDGIN